MVQGEVALGDEHVGQWIVGRGTSILAEETWENAMEPLMSRPRLALWMCSLCGKPTFPLETKDLAC